MTPADVSALLGRYRLPVDTEAALQAEIEQVLTTNEITFEREVEIAPGDRIDFLVGSVGVEVKIKGAKRAILRQCERYAACDRLEGLVLVTAVALGFPDTIEGKPVALHSLGRSWL